MRASRRWRGPSRGSSDRPAAPAADSQEIADLLDNVHRLRLTLSADLATAAGALDADAPAVARDIVDADSREVRRLSETTRHQPHREPARPPVRRRRALLALPAIPLVGALAMTGAAAFTGYGSSTAPRVASHAASPHATDTPGEIRQTAASTLHHLERVVSNHPERAEVVTLATSLHRQLTAILASSVNNAKRLDEVQHLLLVEQRVLETHEGQATAIALAASRHIAHLLTVRGLPTVTPSTTPAVKTTPTKSPTKRPEATKSPTTKSPKSTPTPSDPLPSTRPSTSRPTHHSPHHHHQPKNPLVGQGLFNGAL